MKISALCVTRGNAKLLKRAIACFRHQTEPSRELVIVHQGLDFNVENLPPNERYIEKPKDKTLGELRNVALEHATGEFVIQWDDDDWYHPHRMQVQLEAIVGQPPYRMGAPLETIGEAHAVLLNSWYTLDQETGKEYRSFHRKYGWEGSVLMRRSSALAIRYPHTSKGEDSSFMARFSTRFRVRRIDCPWLYTYIFHGGNTWDRKHFEGIFAQSQELKHGGYKRIIEAMS